MKTILTISKKWNNPQIETTITGEGISLAIDMGDFREALKREIDMGDFVKTLRMGINMGDFGKALKAEIGSVTWTFKKETFDKMLDKAIQNTNGTFEKILDEAINGARITFEKMVDEAIQRVISGIKEESAKVVGRPQ